MKYSEKQGFKVFDWRKELFEMKAHGFDAKKHEIMVQNARRWVTCACGNQCDSIPRKNGEPIDIPLSHLGRSFQIVIKSIALDIKFVDVALENLVQIEDRARFLLKEMHS